MNKEEFTDYHKHLIDLMHLIMLRKNADYTGESSDPFANFKLTEKVGVCSAEKGILTRMLDKLARINSFLDKGVLEVPDEKVEDTLVDLANYSLLLAGLIKSRRTPA